jgi:nitroimidazol reductase NimA-like FMN-containing flavoprotein (pyridoxamine 5'-phosphate oxidase superfamily)
MISYLQANADDDSKKGIAVRRKDKEITDRQRIDEIISQAIVCRLGLCKDNQPYVVPVNFGYDGQHIIFHTARKGLKIDYLEANNCVCFEIEHEVAIIPHPHSACQWGTSFYSVIGFGTAHELVSRDAKVQGLDQVMRHYSDQEWHIGTQQLDQVRVWFIEIERVTGKRSKDKDAPNG